MTSDLKGRDLELETIEPSSLLVQEYAAALMRVTLSGFHGVTAEEVLEVLGQSPEDRKGADDGSVSTEGELWDSCCNGCWKKMLPNTQSIEGF